GVGDRQGVRVYLDDAAECWPLAIDGLDSLQVLLRQRAGSELALGQPIGEVRNGQLGQLEVVGVEFAGRGSDHPGGQGARGAGGEETSPIGLAWIAEYLARAHDSALPGATRGGGRADDSPRRRAPRQECKRYQSPRRNSMSRRFTSAGRSCWIQCPAP